LRHSVHFAAVISSFFFSSPILSGRRLDVYNAFTHDVGGLSANLECRSEMLCTRLAENTGRGNYAKKSPSAHHCTNLSSYVFATKAGIDNRKKNLLNSSISCTSFHNMVNVGPLSAEIGLPVWGTPANFQRVSLLGFVTAATSLNRGQPKFAPCLAVSCAGTLYIHFWRLLPPNVFLPGA